jgi:hypothetical protein
MRAPQDATPETATMSAIDRAGLIDLLGRLGAEDDATVLAAGRQLHRDVSAAGLRWNELLRADLANGDGDEDAAQIDTPDADVTSAAKADVARLLERLLARDSLSGSLRADLLGMKQAIADGSLDDMDVRYIRALAKRLGS